MSEELSMSDDFIFHTPDPKTLTVAARVKDAPSSSEDEDDKDKFPINDRLQGMVNENDDEVCNMPRSFAVMFGIQGALIAGLNVVRAEKVELEEEEATPTRNPRQALDFGLGLGRFKLAPFVSPPK
jgi:hypothetical protein